MEWLNNSKNAIMLLITAVALLLTSGCYYDSEEALFPTLPGSCDTSYVSYSVDIASLLNDYCLMCHSTSTAPSLGNSISLEEYTEFAAQAERVLSSISHEQGFSPMPKGGGKLNGCSIDKVTAWINQGKSNN